MSTPAPFETLRVSDGALLRLATEMIAIDPSGSASFKVLGNTGVELSAEKPLAAKTKATLSNSSFFITQATIRASQAGCTVEYRRGQIFKYAHGGWNWSRTETPFLDGFAIEGPKEQHRDAILQAISKTISLAPPGELEEGTSSLERADRILTRLSDAAAQVFEQTVERQRDLDEYRQTLERDAVSKLDAERARLHAVQEKATFDLAEREKAFEERAGTFDDRSNTHVRRALQESMAKLSDDTLSSRLLDRSMLPFVIPIVIATAALAMLATFIVTEIANLDRLAVAIQTTITNTEIAAGEKPNLLAAINRTILFGQVRLALQTAGVGLLVWFMLRFAGTRYRQISRWEHELHKFRLDTERASFLIEGELEARRIDGQVLPEVVLDRFSRGLFTSSGGDVGNDTDEIGATLGHLLGRAAKLKLGTDGVSVEVDKPGLKKARRDVARESGAEE